MIISLKPDAADFEKEKLFEQLHLLEHNCFYTGIYGQQSLVLSTPLNADEIKAISASPAILKITPVNKEYKLTSRIWKDNPTTFSVKGQCIGGKAINIIAGPCSVENESQIYQTAEYLHKLGIKFIRGGAYKPRTSPYSFQGLGKEGLRLIRKAADEFDLRVVTEVIDSSLIDEIYEYADILQVGSRNMQNFYFLKQLGKTDKPILLKRGMASKVEEWMNAAEYILAEGNGKVILCERGIKTFDNSMRNTMDIGAIPLAKQLSHLPVFADPSHGTGRRNLVGPMALAAIAAGADGIMIEVHPNPEKALSDGAQSLYLEQFKDLVEKMNKLAAVSGRLTDNQLEPFTSQKPEICVE